jgi:alkanesulfonate monooxygenase SsuD/methylene tetrahydromethanopterin reductase-like flavin-dependent oxidoreductase (luciferase family)
VNKKLEGKIEMAVARFGVQFRNFPSQFGNEILDRMIEVANKCEVLGFDSVWMVDHLEMRPPISYESQPIPECWSAISALASSTRKIKIGSLVTCSLFRNPYYLSKICSTINEISNGRIIAGIGSGWFEEEFGAYGISYPKPSERIAATRKALTIIRESNGPSAFPIWIGGSGEGATLKLVAKLADGCSLFGDPNIVRRKLEVLERYCNNYGRKPEQITKSKQSNVVIGEDEKEVALQLRKIVTDESKWPTFISNNIVGTPDECRAQVQRYLESGIEYLTLSFPDLFETNCLDIFSSEVIG